MGGTQKEDVEFVLPGFIEESVIFDFTVFVLEKACRSDNAGCQRQ